VTTAVCAI